MLFTSRAFSASGIARRWMAWLAVPMTVDSENAPARSPAAVPTSYPRRRERTTAVTSEATQMTTVSASCGRASFFRPRKNCGPTL